MKTIQLVVAGGLLVAGGLALAQSAPQPTPKDKEKKEATAPAAGAPAMEEPKPPPELQELKGMIGNWKCDGKGTAGPETFSMKGTAKFAFDYGDYFVVANIVGPKSKEMPGGYKETDFYSYDPAAKQFVLTGFDNMGGMTAMTSKGWEGDTQSWAGKYKIGGHEMDAKLTVTRKGDKEVHVVGTEASPGMTVTVDQTCKR
jgi:hypothetical protein